MTDDLETVALRPTVVDGQVQADDYEVIWRGLLVGQIMKQLDSPHWWWCCNLYGQPPTANDRGPAINFKDGQLRFKLAWTQNKGHTDGRRYRGRNAARGSPTTAIRARGNRRSNRRFWRGKMNGRARQRVLKAATMEFDGGTDGLRGAEHLGDRGRPRSRQPRWTIPSEFNLLISGHGTSHRCQVKWRKENRIGVAFK